MDNFSLGNTEAEQLDLLPELEALARLYELIERYATGDDASIVTAAGRHRAVHGHPLAFGCCRGKNLRDLP